MSVLNEQVERDEKISRLCSESIEVLGIERYSRVTPAYFQRTSDTFWWALITSLLGNEKKQCPVRTAEESTAVDQYPRQKRINSFEMQTRAEIRQYGWQLNPSTKRYQFNGG